MGHLCQAVEERKIHWQLINSLKVLRLFWVNVFIEHYEYFKLPHPIYRWNHCNHYDYTINKRAKYTFYRCIKEAVLDNLAIIKNRFSVQMVDCIYLWLKWVRELIFYKTFFFRAGLIELGHWDRQCFFFFFKWNAFLY